MRLEDWNDDGGIARLMSSILDFINLSCIRSVPRLRWKAGINLNSPVGGVGLLHHYGRLAWSRSDRTVVVEVGPASYQKRLYEMTSNPHTIKRSRAQMVAHLSCSRLYAHHYLSVVKRTHQCGVCSFRRADHERRSRSSDMGGPRVVGVYSNLATFATYLHFQYGL